MVGAIFFIVLIMVFILLIPFSFLAHYALMSIPIFEMILQLMVLVLFTSTMGFAVSTMVKNGNATAVVMVIFGLVFLILADGLAESKWNILLNPFRIPGDVNEIIWHNTIRQTESSCQS